MGKTRHWLLIALGSLGILVGSTPTALGSTLVEHNSIPDVEQRWNAASFSSSLETNAPPEFGRCLKTVGGKYQDAGCLTTGSGKEYEWYPAFGSAQPLVKTHFTTVIKEGTTAVLETVGKNSVTCQGESASGEFTGNKTIGNVVMTFTKCSAFGMACASASAPAETIVTSPLEGMLGVEELGAEPALNAIGEALFPTEHSGATGEFSCGGVPLAITGSIISPIPDNVMKLKTGIKSKAVGGKQHPEKFLGEPAEVLISTINGGSPEQAGETLQVVQTSEEKVEINSVL
jgi:hypothetical protein